MISTARGLLAWSPGVSDKLAAELVLEADAGFLPGGIGKQKARKLAEEAVAEARKSLKALSAKPFVPDEGEKPDENGYYWRTIRGMKVPFYEGGDFDEIVDMHTKNRRFADHDAGRFDYDRASAKPGGGYLDDDGPDDGDSDGEDPDDGEPDYAAEEMRNLSEEYEEVVYEQRSFVDGLLKGLLRAAERKEISELEAGALISGYGEMQGDDELDSKIAEYERMWEEAAAESKTAAREWKKIKKYRDGVQKSMKKAYETAESFYRGTDTRELAELLETGESTSGMLDGAASLTVRPEVAAQFGSGLSEGDGRIRDDGVVVEYDAESVRKTGKANPMRYDLQRASGYGAEGKALTLEWAHQEEVQMPLSTGPLKIKAVTMTEKAARENRKLVKAMEKAGIEVTLINGWHLEDLYMRFHT